MVVVSTCATALPVQPESDRLVGVINFGAFSNIGKNPKTDDNGRTGIGNGVRSSSSPSSRPGRRTALLHADKAGVPMPVGWAMATHLRTELILNALNMAIYQRRLARAAHPN
jgi:hypothetical protein